jgi:hypothetical protein
VIAWLGSDRVEPTANGRFTVVKSLIVAILLGFAVAGTTVAQDTLTGYSGTVALEGTIDGANVAQVRVYQNGLMSAAAESDVAGAYNLEFEVSGQTDETVVVWFLPDTEGVVPTLLVLKESSEARRNAIWSPCVPRLKLSSTVTYDVKFLSDKDLLKSLQGSDCFDR